jgi:hypothetical protein
MIILVRQKILQLGPSDEHDSQRILVLPELLELGSFDVQTIIQFDVTGVQLRLFDPSVRPASPPVPPL